MKILYLSPRDLRKNRSDAVHMVLSANAFARSIEAVTLLSPHIEREVAERSLNLPAIYGLDSFGFDIKELGPRIQEKESFLFSWKLIIIKVFFNLMFALRHVKQLNEDCVIYSKCFISTLPYLFMKRLGIINAKLVFETITPKQSWLHKYVFKYSDGIISHMIFVNQELISNFGVDEKKILTAPMITQANEVRKYTEDRHQLRSELGFNLTDFYIMYAGKTGVGVKEVDYFIQAAQELPALRFIIVGANEVALKLYEDLILKESIKNIEVRPFQPLSSYYKHVLAADILVGYYPGTAHNRFHLSPGKGGVYLASGNPCIFSDLPSLRSIYPEGSVFYAEADNFHALAKKIEWVHDHPEEAQQYAKVAMDFAMSSNYNRFAKEILAFIEKC